MGHITHPNLGSPMVMVSPEARLWVETKFADDSNIVHGYKMADGLPRISCTDYLYSIAEGQIAGHTTWSKNSYNIDVGTSEEDLWGNGGLNNWIVVPGSLAFRSSNAADDKNGIGARCIYINYLDRDYVQKIESIQLSGTNVVWSLGSDIFRINNFRVCEVGASGVAIGTIYAGSPTIYSTILPGLTRARNSQYTVPSGLSLFVTSFGYTAGGGKDVRITNRATHDNITGSFTGPAGSIGAYFLPYSEAILDNSNYNKTLEMPTRLPSKTDIKISAVALSVGGAIVTGALRGWLEAE